MQKALPFIVVAFILFLLVAMNSPRSSRSTTEVTLSSAPHNEIVQMFEFVGPGDEGKVTTFRNGTICQKLSGPSVVTIEDIRMTFYKLDCGENTGYVNARWVDD